jgi:hypothetical protein
VDSLALSALWMRFSWLVVEAMDAEKLRLLRLTKGRQRKASASQLMGWSAAGL